LYSETLETNNTIGANDYPLWGGPLPALTTCTPDDIFLTLTTQRP